MDPNVERDPRVLRSFWISCGLVATGAIAALLLTAGGPSLILGGAISFAVAAIAMAVNALTYPRGMGVAIGLYIIAWLAVVYGILRMIAAPIQLIVVGTCPAQIGCTPEFSNAFSGGEGVAIAVGIATGALALQVGLFGIRILYRGPQKPKAPAAARTMWAPSPAAAVPETASAPPSPPAGQIDAPSGATTTEPPAQAPVVTPRRARKPRIKTAPAQVAELPAPIEPAELPAHEEQAELPPHAESPEPGSSTTSSD